MPLSRSIWYFLCSGGLHSGVWEACYEGGYSQTNTYSFLTKPQLGMQEWILNAFEWIYLVLLVQWELCSGVQGVCSEGQHSQTNGKCIRVDLSGTLHSSNIFNAYPIGHKIKKNMYSIPHPCCAYIKIVCVNVASFQPPPSLGFLVRPTNSSLFLQVLDNVRGVYTPGMFFFMGCLFVYVFFGLTMPQPHVAPCIPLRDIPFAIVSMCRLHVQPDSHISWLGQSNNPGNGGVLLHIPGCGAHGHWWCG